MPQEIKYKKYEWSAAGAGCYSGNRNEAGADGRMQRKFRYWWKNNAIRKMVASDVIFSHPSSCKNTVVVKRQLIGLIVVLDDVQSQNDINTGNMERVQCFKCLGTDLTSFFSSEGEEITRDGTHGELLRTKGRIKRWLLDEMVMRHKEREHKKRRECIILNQKRTGINRVFVCCLRLLSVIHSYCIGGCFSDEMICGDWEPM